MIKGFTFAIRKTLRVFWKNESKNKKKYFFSFYLRVKKKDVLLHPLTDRATHGLLKEVM